MTHTTAHANGNTRNSCAHINQREFNPTYTRTQRAPARRKRRVTQREINRTRLAGIAIIIFGIIFANLTGVGEVLLFTLIYGIYAATYNPRKKRNGNRRRTAPVQREYVPQLTLIHCDGTRNAV